MKFKNLIFDFGGVLYNIDYFASIKALARLSDFPERLDLMPLADIMNLPADFEKGLISSEFFRDYLRKNYHIRTDDFSIDSAWNAMLLGLKPESVQFISSLKNKYRIYLLSNTNIIHYNYFFTESKELFEQFDKVFLSYEINMRKPDVEIYDFVCNSLEILPKECLFIDDSESNIIGAERAGLNTYHFTSDKALSDLLHTI
jgi:putative hydrolase of the HAD superfamily